MDNSGLIVLGAFVVWFGAFYAVFSYPVYRLRPLLDEGARWFNPLICRLRGHYQGRVVSFQYRGGSRTSGPSRFLVEMQLRRVNVIQPEKQAALEGADIFICVPHRPPGSTVHFPPYGYISETHTPWAEAWFTQPEVKRVLDDLFGPRQLQSVQLKQGALKSRALSPWKASRPENVQAILDHFVALEESLARSARTQ